MASESQSLYRKWRSQTFSDLIGQEAVTRTLLNAVRDGRLAHAYLFCGPRGTGKTSAARLLAKAVNCANPQNGEPCNKCVSCQEITRGNSPDVIEIDAASNTGVDNIRDLRENVNLMASGGRYKVVVVDEVHMLSTAAFNALLKTLEEPPPHVIFVLATTDAQKVLATVVSRCQRFDFHRFSVRDIVARLNHVAQGEGYTIEPAAAEMLARAAQGGMRDALSLLDQAVAFCGDHVDYERTRQMLGLADVTAIRTLLGYVAAQRPAEGLELLNQLITTGADLRQLNQQIGEEWRALLLARAGANVAQLLDRPDEDARDIQELASRFTLEQLMACARAFTRNDGPARGLPVPQLALELSFLECVCACDPSQPTPATSAPEAAARMQSPSLIASAPTTNAYTPGRVAQPAQPMSTPPRPAPAPSQPLRIKQPPVEELDLAAIDRDRAPRATPTQGSPISQASHQEASTNAGAGEGDDEWGDTRDIIDDEEAPEAPEAPDEAEWMEATPSEPVDAEDTPIPLRQISDTSMALAPAKGSSALSAERDWLTEAQDHWALIKKICRQRPESGAMVGALLNHAYPVLMEAGEPGNLPTLIIQAKYDFHARSLREPEKRAIIEWAIEQTLDAPLQVRIIQEGSPGGPGAPVGARAGKRPAGPTASAGQRAAPAASAPRAPAPRQPAQGASDSASSRPSAPSIRNGANAPRLRETPEDTAYRPTTMNGAHGQNGASKANGRQAPPPHLDDYAPTSKALTPDQAMAQASADPVVQEISRLLGMELAEAHPLDTDTPNEPLN